MRPKPPFDAPTVLHDTGDVLAEPLFEFARPRHELEAEPVVDHGEPPRGKPREHLARRAEALGPRVRGRLVAALASASDRILHGVALVEDDHSVEVGAQPFNDLPDTRKLLATLVGA